MTIADLAQRTGLSKGMLSKIENAQASPSLATLVRIAGALELPTTAFLADFEARKALHVKAGHGVDLPAGAGSRTRTQLLGSLAESSRRMEPLLVTLKRGAKVSPIFRHGGIELLYVVEGSMEYEVGEEVFTLSVGDSLQFDGEYTHGPNRVLGPMVRFLSVKTQGTGGREGEHRVH